MLLPTKFIPIIQPSLKGIIKLQIIPVMDVLQLSYKIYGLKFVTETIISSLHANPSNEDLFESLDKELYVQHSLNIIDTEQILLYLKNNIAKLDPQSTQLFQVMFPAPNGKKITLSLSYLQIYSIMVFVEQFVTSYEIFRLTLISEAAKEQKIIIEEKEKIDTIEPNINTTLVNTDELIEKVEEIEIDNKSIDMLSLLNDSLKISPNNICSYFISKHIYYNINNIQKTAPIKIIDNNVKLSIIPITSHYKDVLGILQSFSFSKDEYVSKLKLLFQQLIYIISYYLSNEDKELAKETTVINIQIIHFLIMLYGSKLTDKNIFLSDTYINQFIQYIIMNHLDQHKIKYSLIEFESLVSEDVTPYTRINDNLDQILTKEKYMLDIDAELYIKNVINQTSSLNQKKNTANVKLKLHPSTPINIHQLLNKTTVGLLGYKLLKPKEKQFQIHKMIISKEYYDILLISTTPTLSKTTIEKELNPICTKYADIILNSIFKELSTVVDKDIIMSTLILLEQYIRPALKVETDLEIELFILYRIVIPYLVDIYNIVEFVDYFHS